VEVTCSLGFQSIFPEAGLATIPYLRSQFSASRSESRKDRPHIFSHSAPTHLCRFGGHGTSIRFASMARARGIPLRTWSGMLLLLFSLMCFSPLSSAASTERKYVPATDESGNRIWLDDNRRPALYTQNFGDCQGDSLINVTRFDAAYYRDNMTILFHLAGNTALANESLMREFECVFPLDLLLTVLDSLHWGLCVWRASF
jgi:ML-like domain